MARPSTVPMEESLLYHVTHIQSVARMILPRLRESMFTSSERAFICKSAKDVYEKTHGLLSELVFNHELGKLPESERKLASAAYNIVCTRSDPQDCETLISKLAEEELGRTIAEQLSKEKDLLVAGNFKELERTRKVAALSTTGSIDHIRLVDYSDYKRREQTIADKKANPEKYLGIKTGFKTFDERTGGVFPGELTLIAAVTGLGKSTLVKQLVANFVMQGKNVLLAANEEYLEQVEHKLDAVFTGIPYQAFKRATLDADQMTAWKKKIDHDMSKMGKLYIEEVPAFTDVSLVEYAYRKLEAKGIKIDVILIDHLPLIKPIQAAMSTNDEEKKTSADCKELARSLRVPVIVPTQAATCVEEKQSKGKRAGKLDVYGSRTQIHVANVFVILTFKRKICDDESVPEYLRDVVLLADIKKNRDGPPFSFTIRHKVQCGQLEEIDDAGMAVEAALADSSERALKGDYSTPASASDITDPSKSVDAVSSEELQLLDALETEPQFDPSAVEEAFPAIETPIPSISEETTKVIEHSAANLFKGNVSEPIVLPVIEEKEYLRSEVTTTTAMSLAEKIKARRKLNQ